MKLSKKIRLSAIVIVCSLPSLSSTFSTDEGVRIGDKNASAIARPNSDSILPVAGMITSLLDLKDFCHLRETSRRWNQAFGKIGIQFLNLGDFPRLTDAHFVQVLTSYPNLKGLRVPSSFNLLGLGSQPAFQTAFGGLQKLQTLEFDGGIMFGETREQLTSFFTTFSNLDNLQTLCLFNAPYRESNAYWDTNGNNLVLALQLIHTQSKRARCFKLTSLTVANSCVTDSGVDAIEDTFYRLTSLNLEGNLGIRARIGALASTYRLPYLKLINLTGNNNIPVESRELLKKKFGAGVKFEEAEPTQQEKT